MISMPYTNEKGQTIVAMFFVMILALAVGIAVSTRFIRLVRTSSDVDASYRALAIAEAAVEKMLLTPNTTLKNYIDFGSCGSECVLGYTGPDGVVSTANVTLSYVGNSSDPVPVQLTVNDVVEVTLNGYPTNRNVHVCWNNPVSGDRPSVTGVLLYGSTGSYDIKNFAYNSIGSLYSSNGFSVATANFGYANCFSVMSSVAPVLMRLRTLYNDVDAYVLPDTGLTLPSQGILIEATGTVLDSQRKVSVIKTDPFLPLPFDFVLQTRSETEPLSNQ